MMDRRKLLGLTGAMAKRTTQTVKPKQRSRDASLWMDTANLPTSLARRKSKPQAIWKMTACSSEGSQNHYLQLADAVLKRVTFEAPTTNAERLPYLVSKVG